MFLSKRPVKTTIQLDCFVSQLNIREISKPVCRVSLSYKGTGKIFKNTREVGVKHEQQASLPVKSRNETLD